METGVNVEPVRNLTWRTTFFDDRFTHAVSNITIVSPNLAQRQNVGRTQIWGIQSDVEYRLFSDWKITSAYLYDLGQVKEFVQNPAIVGKVLAQVPRNRGTFGVEYTNTKLADVAVQYHYTSSQYDDDVNTLTRRLGGFGTVDLTVSRQLREDLDVFFNLQNMFDKEFVFRPIRGRLALRGFSVSDSAYTFKNGAGNGAVFHFPSLRFLTFSRRPVLSNPLEAEKVQREDQSNEYFYERVCLRFWFWPRW